MHLKTALANIRRSPFQAMSAIMVLALSFFVASVIAILIYSSSQVLEFFETRPQVIAFLKSDAKDEDIKTLDRRLRNDVRIKEVKFVSKEEALNIYKTATSDNPLLGQLVSPSIFPASIEFSVKDLNDAAKVIEETRKEVIIDSVGFTASLGKDSNLEEVLGRLTKITFYIRVGGLILMIALGMTSFVVLMVIVGMRVAFKKGEIETLKLMGATGGFIRAPIIIEAVLYVTGGVIIGWLGAFVLFLYTTPALLRFFGPIPVVPRDSGGFLSLNLSILGIEVFVGLVIAIVGGWIAVTKATSK